METAIAIFWILLKIIGWVALGFAVLMAIMVIMAFWLIPRNDGYYHDHFDGINHE